MLINPKYQQNDNHLAYLIGCCRDLMRPCNTTQNPQKRCSLLISFLFVISWNLNLYSRSLLSSSIQTSNRLLGSYRATQTLPNSHVQKHHSLSCSHNLHFLSQVRMSHLQCHSGIWLAVETSPTLSPIHPTTAQFLLKLPPQCLFTFNTTSESQEFMISYLGHFYNF